ncbi:PTS N-acetylgalactosamine transporter subunit IIA, partial [Vibrio anguillarum]|nr:PTS N-acetylgalactosamine transporter subunit IIA [Vibrio anguillarum]
RGITSLAAEIEQRALIADTVEEDGI